MKLKSLYLAVAQALAAPIARYAENNLLLNAVVNTKSTIVANADATPRIESKLWYDGARVYESVASIELAAADDDTSVYRFFRVRSNWRISSLEIACDTVTAGTSYDIGVWDTAENGGAVVDADAARLARTVGVAAVRRAVLT